MAANLLPGVAAVSGFEQAASGAAPGAVLPRTLTRLPKSGVDDVGVVGIDLHIGAAHVRPFIEHFLKRLAAIGRTENTALFIGPVRVPEHGDKKPVGIVPVDRNIRNLLAIAQAEMGPGFAAIAG